MKNSRRWVLFIAGIGVLVFGMYFINLSWLFWPPYHTMGWRPPYFGPRTFPGVSLFGLLIAFITGFALCKWFLPSSGFQQKKEEKFCPFCGRDLQQRESIPGVRPEDLGKEKE
jgi:hypothetical protein